MKYTQLFIGCLMSLLLSACAGSRQLTYLSTGSFSTESVASTDALMPGDELFIQVSAVDARAVEMFNAPGIALGNDIEVNCRVAEDGTLYLPSLGAIPVAGLSQAAVQDTLTHRIALRVKDPIVLVMRVNAYVTVLGEVNEPGRFVMQGPVTLLDALGMAKDMTPNGRRDNILVVRKQAGQVKEYRLNLLDKSVMTSPAFFLQKGDVVYVAPRYAQPLYNRH